MPGDRVAGVLLAAGGSTRFGGDKLAADWAGGSLLQHAATAMLDAGLGPVLAVVQPGRDRLLPDGAVPVLNHDWCAGISSSIQTGLAALADTPHIEAAVIAPADQPWCGAAVYRRLIDAYQGSGRSVVVAAFGGAVRNPVLLARGQWRLAARIDGDQGLSAVVRGCNPLTVECADIGSIRDIDTPADLPAPKR